MKKTFGPQPLLYNLPVWVVGTFNKDGDPCVMTASWGGVCNSIPPCVAVSIKKNRQTHKNIVNRKAFTVNVPSSSYVRETDYFGLASEGVEDKFAFSGLMPVKSSVVDAPYVEEFPVVAECKLLRTLDLGSHVQVIGEIIDLKVDENALDERGRPDINRIKPFCYDPQNRKYYGVKGDLGEAFKMGRELAPGANTDQASTL
ncbi:MAG: flavin reductase family protein [Planctomycetes bacterium]|nr:flavin reductase family protein [Planctomycetota bacterium]